MQAHWTSNSTDDVVIYFFSMQEEGPKVDKSKKKLNSARLDMDTAKSR